MIVTIFYASCTINSVTCVLRDSFLQIADDLYLVLDVGMSYVQGCEHLCGYCMKQSEGIINPSCHGL